jgi:hypothetical protein
VGRSGVREEADLIYGFSGVMEELLRRPRMHAGQLHTVVHDSATCANRRVSSRAAHPKRGTALGPHCGTLCARKGTFDIFRIAVEMQGRADSTVVGTTITLEVGHLLSQARSAISTRRRKRVAESLCRLGYFRFRYH